MNIDFNLIKNPILWLSLSIIIAIIVLIVTDNSQSNANINCTSSQIKKDGKCVSVNGYIMSLDNKGIHQCVALDKPNTDSTQHVYHEIVACTADLKLQTCNPNYKQLWNNDNTKYVCYRGDPVNWPDNKGPGGYGQDCCHFGPLRDNCDGDLTKDCGNNWQHYCNIAGFHTEGDCRWEHGNVPQNYYYCPHDTSRQWKLCTDGNGCIDYYITNPLHKDFPEGLGRTQPDTSVYDKPIIGCNDFSFPDDKK